MYTAQYLMQKTRFAFLITRLLNIPLWALLSLLTLILYKEMQISALQIAIFISLKPLSALFAPYWSSPWAHRKDRLVSNLVWANILRYLPFLFFPWIESPWLMIFAFGTYMMLQRGAMPAWMEIFKRNIKGVARERVFAYGSALDYLGPALLMLGLAVFLDDYHISWRWLFFVTAILGLSSTFFLYMIPAEGAQASEAVKSDISIVDLLTDPWKQSWKLIKENSDFSKYQWGFMLGGSGLILMHATLPMFLVDVLNLSYTEMALAIALCKGIGFVVTSPFWVQLFRRVDLYFFSGLVTILGALFPFLLIGAEYHLLFFYFAYFLYGFMQAGSELSWHMSGPVFSKDQDSSAYSQTNVLTVGMRGCVAPYAGSLLYSFTGNSTVVLLVGAFFCALATIKLLQYSKSSKLISQSTSTLSN